MLCMLPLRGVSVRRLDRCIPSFSPLPLSFAALLPPCFMFVRLRASMAVRRLSEFTHTLSSLFAVFCGGWLGPCLSAVHARACRGCSFSGWPCLCSSWVVLPFWFCGVLLFRCCWFVLLAWLPVVALVAWVLAVLPALSWLPPSLPSPRGCPLGFSGPASVLLVPPSGYLVVSATVWLSYLWHGVSWPIGSCPHSASWQQRLRPCVGLCPLHHGVGVVHVPFAPALRYSPSGDPESP